MYFELLKFIQPSNSAVRHYHRSGLLNMPKKKSSGAKKDQQDKSSGKKETPQPVVLDSNNHILIKIHAKPGAKENAITDISENAVGIQIAAPPVEGEANTELVKYLANVLNLRKSDVSLDRGSRSREKTIVITSEKCTVDSILTSLKQATNKS